MSQPVGYLYGRWSRRFLFAQCFKATSRTLRPCQALHLAVAFPPSAAVYLRRHGIVSETREGRTEGA